MQFLKYMIQQQKSVEPCEINVIVHGRTHKSVFKTYLSRFMLNIPEGGQDDYTTAAR